MRKFLAVVKHEYKKIVYKWTFLAGTLLFPVIGAGFAVVPAIIFSLKGEPTRLVIVDQSGKIGPRLRQELSREHSGRDEGSALDLTAPQSQRLRDAASKLGTGFKFVPFNAAGKSPDHIRQELNALTSGDVIDAFVLIPADINDPRETFEFRSRKGGDLGETAAMEEAVNSAVRSERLAEANIDERLVEDLSRDVVFDSKSLNDKGEEKDSDVLFIASLVIGMMIYITLTIYGQLIMGAVVEEKETRIAEILFSSARPFQLMAGKLVGVGLAGLTQLGIWVASLVAVIAFLSTQADVAEAGISLPHITPLMVIYFFIFFIVGYFMYASIFALIGSMVTTVQEGGQFAFPPIMIMLIGFYFSFAVIRDPNSSLSFWVSIAPLFAPLTMPVRILAETPPFWQIGLAITLNCIAIAVFVWIASRVYRVGMLMYGKRASIPEVLKWIRQA